MVAMLPSPFHNALVLTGPTGSGKTALGLELAQRLNAEIISMDSMALYRRMDIGTAKPTPHERTLVPHHLIDVREPWESASVAWWLDEAKRCVADIEARGKQVLFVGGTPLYLKALMCGLFEGPPADEQIRRRLIEEARIHSSEELHRRLAAVDPVCAQRLHPNDVRRMVRALEVYELTGKPMSAWQTQWNDRGPSSVVHGETSAKANQFLATDHGPRTADQILWLDLPREELYARINQRVDAMFAAGLIEEVRALRALKRPLSPEAFQALGYKEIYAYLDRKATLDETIVQVKTRSRNFSRRQIGWFRHLPDCRSVSKELTFSLWRSRMDRWEQRHFSGAQ